MKPNPKDQVARLRAKIDGLNADVAEWKRATAMAEAATARAEAKSADLQRKLDAAHDDPALQVELAGMHGELDAAQDEVARLKLSGPSLWDRFKTWLMAG